MIEAPRLIKYLSVGIVIEAIEKSKDSGYIKEYLIPCLLLCVKKKGMTPFLNIFYKLSLVP